MTSAKLTNDLSDKLQGMGKTSDTLRVVLELYPNPDETSPNAASRQEKIRYQKQQFQAGLDAVSEVIHQDGGKLLDSAWINRTVLAEVPVSALGRITDMPEVASVDTPRPLTTD
ncbi:hypothetical protein A0256_03300 [Mucilaginibacter sp. PAMC 26640]|nr:hypothetical protein A0256_03300 [Mucilaginibacter sp. PAMC 26640]